MKQYWFRENHYLTGKIITQLNAREITYLNAETLTAFTEND